MMRPTIFISILAFTLVFLPGIADAAEIYKCVDENGKVVYQNTPCKGAESVEKLPIESEATDPAAVEARGEAREEKLKDYAERAREKREARDKAETERQQKKQACEAARERLVKLNTARRVRAGEDSDQAYLTNEQIAERRQEAQEAVRKACGN